MNPPGWGWGGSSAGLTEKERSNNKGPWLAWDCNSKRAGIAAELELDLGVLHAGITSTESVDKD